MTFALHKRRVEVTEDFRRIEALERRTEVPADLVERMTYALRRPGGTQILRPIQAWALAEIGTRKGLFAPIRVGGGKTLISLLAPFILQSKSPILLLPAALVQKTYMDLKEYAKHWPVPNFIRIISYEMLGRENGAQLLELYRPDLIVSDEVHRLKNKKAAVSRRVSRYMAKYPETHFVAMSGTIIKDSLRNFAHVARWCLKNNAPVPSTDGELDEWADALDEKVNPLQRSHPGILLTLPGASGPDALSKARNAFRRRLVETPGVVATASENVDCSLYIRPIEYSVSKQTEDYFRTLRLDWETPDGWAFDEAIESWRHANELALGLCYRWMPHPPRDWLNTRRDWAKFVRDILSRSRTLDSEKQVKTACRDGKYTRFHLDAWETIEPTFTVNPRATWFDDSALKVCENWIKQGPGIVWCRHTFFAEELSRRTGLPYYGAQGVDKNGAPIEQANPKKACIASVKANATGRNLQMFCRNLLTSCPDGPAEFEQLLGRTHRDGQQADTVEVDMLLGCFEHYNGWQTALSGARMIQDLTGATQKLLLADTPGWPTETEMRLRGGFRWQKSE